MLAIERERQTSIFSIIDVTYTVYLQRVEVPDSPDHHFAETKAPISVAAGLLCSFKSPHPAFIVTQTEFRPDSTDNISTSSSISVIIILYQCKQKPIFVQPDLSLDVLCCNRMIKVTLK